MLLPVLFITILSIFYSNCTVNDFKHFISFLDTGCSLQTQRRSASSIVESRETAEASPAASDSLGTRQLTGPRRAPLHRPRLRRMRPAERRPQGGPCNSAASRVRRARGFQVDGRTVRLKRRELFLPAPAFLYNLQTRDQRNIQFVDPGSQDEQPSRRLQETAIRRQYYKCSSE